MHQGFDETRGMHAVIQMRWETNITESPSQNIESYYDGNTEDENIHIGIIRSLSLNSVLNATAICYKSLQDY